MINKMKMFVKKNFIYFNTGMLFTGIMIFFLSSQLFHTDPIINEAYTAGSICIAIWYLSFPYLAFGEKDKFLLKISIHTILSLSATLAMLYAAIYFIDNKYKLEHTIFNTVLLLFGSSYFLYFLRLFFVTCHRCIQKIIKFIESRIEPDIDSKTKKITSIIEGITAILVTLTGFIVALSAFIKIIKI